MHIISQKKNLSDAPLSFDQYGTTQVDLGLVPKQQPDSENIVCATLSMTNEEESFSVTLEDEQFILCAAGELKTSERCDDQLIGGMVHVGTMAASMSIKGGNVIKRVTIYGSNLISPSRISALFKAVH